MANSHPAQNGAGKKLALEVELKLNADQLLESVGKVWAGNRTRTESTHSAASSHQEEGQDIACGHQSSTQAAEQLGGSQGRGRGRGGRRAAEGGETKAAETP